MMGYRSTLLRSIIVLTLFYAGGSAILFYALEPTVLEAWLVERGLWDVAADGRVTPVNALTAAHHGAMVRVAAVWPWLLGGVITSICIALLGVGVLALVRQQRGKSHGEYRGMSLTITRMPGLQSPRCRRVKVEPAGDVAEEQKPLLHQLLGFLSQHQNAFVGPGHGVTLLEHHLGVLDKAFDYTGADPLLALAACAHDIGKVASHVKNADGEWERIGKHDKAGARLLASMPGWWALPHVDRSILLLVTKYSHSPGQLPQTFPRLSKADMERTRTVLEQLREIDGETTAEEKRHVLKAEELPALALDAFMRVLPQVPFQVKGLPKGVKAVGFRVDERLYLSEFRIRQEALQLLDDDAAAALGGEYRDRGKPAQYTQALLSALEEKGWLIRAIQPPDDKYGNTPEPWVMSEKDALWKVRSGELEWRGMLAIELPEEHRSMYPKETAYEVEVIGPQGVPIQSGTVPVYGSGKRALKVQEPVEEIPMAEVCEIDIFGSTFESAAAASPVVEPSPAAPPAKRPSAVQQRLEKRRAQRIKPA